MNKVILMGRLTKDPDIRSTAGAQPVTVARYTLAVTSMRKDAQGNYVSDFISCVAFGKLGEFAQKYLAKGNRVLVSGHWQTGSYTDRDGRKVYTNDCIIDSQEFAESKGSGSTSQSAPVPHEVGDGFMQIPDNVEDEGLPFN